MLSFFASPATARSSCMLRSASSAPSRCGPSSAARHASTAFIATSDCMRQMRQHAADVGLLVQRRSGRLGPFFLANREREHFVGRFGIADATEADERLRLHARVVVVQRRHEQRRAADCSSWLRRSVIARKANSRMLASLRQLQQCDVRRRAVELLQREDRGDAAIERRFRIAGERDELHWARPINAAAQQLALAMQPIHGARRCEITDELFVAGRREIRERLRHKAGRLHLRDEADVRIRVAEAAVFPTAHIHQAATIDVDIGRPRNFQERFLMRIEARAIGRKVVAINFARAPIATVKRIAVRSGPARVVEIHRPAARTAAVLSQGGIVSSAKLMYCDG